MIKFGMLFAVPQGRNRKTDMPTTTKTKRLSNRPSALPTASAHESGVVPTPRARVETPVSPGSYRMRAAPVFEPDAPVRAPSVRVPPQAPPRVSGLSTGVVAHKPLALPELERLNPSVVLPFLVQVDAGRGKDKRGYQIQPDDPRAEIARVAHESGLLYQRYANRWILTETARQWLAISQGRNAETMIQASEVTRFQLRRLAGVAGLTVTDTLAQCVEDAYTLAFPEG